MPRTKKVAIIPTHGDELAELHRRQRALVLANKKVTVALRLPVELYKGLIEVAERTHAESFTWLAVRALGEWLTHHSETDFAFFPGAIVPGSLAKAGILNDPMKPMRERYAGQSQAVRAARLGALQEQADLADTELQVSIRRAAVTRDIAAAPRGDFDAPLPSGGKLPDLHDDVELPPLTKEEAEFIAAQGSPLGGDR